MHEKTPSDLPLDTADSNEQELWDALAELPHPEPSPHLRRAFYARMEQYRELPWGRRLRDLLGLRESRGWMTATACLMVGLFIGQTTDQWLGGVAAKDKDVRLASLEQDVAILTRSLILDRLSAPEPGKRLRGVLDASQIAGQDAEIAQALLHRATEDRIPSVRSAAIEALGQQVNTPAIGGRVMDSIVTAESPLVQLALIDLVLRNGDQQQLATLLAMAEQQQLFPDISQHVLTSLKGEFT